MSLFQQQQWIDPLQQRMAEQENAMNFAKNQGSTFLHFNYNQYNTKLLSITININININIVNTFNIIVIAINIINTFNLLLSLLILSIQLIYL